MSRTRRMVVFACIITMCGLGGANYQQARAAVVHGIGFQATVAGWTSWYGSYQLVGVGQVWCIDHGLRAPDTVLGYRPTAAPSIPADDQAAMAWAIGMYGANPSPLDAAAVMLVLHELNGAAYPFGPLHIENAALGGFNGQEDALRSRAIAIRGDALAHRSLRGPISAVLEMPSRLTPGLPVKATVTVRDARGAPVAGQHLSLRASGAALDRSEVTTGPDGRAITHVTAWENTTVTAVGTTTDPALRVLGPAGAPAQRVAVPGHLTLHAQAEAHLGQGRLQIRKTGDAAPKFSVAGTAFRITSARPGPGTAPIEVRVGSDGTTPALELAVGRYVVEETAPAPGYRGAGPWTVDIVPGQTRTLTVENKVARSTLRLAKIDEATGKPLAGAVLVLSSDFDGDGHQTQVGKPLLTTTSPIELAGLRPGTYSITEQSAPPGYERFAPRQVELAPGVSIEITLTDRRSPTTSTTTPPSTTVPVTSPTSTTAPKPSTSSTTSTTTPTSEATPSTPTTGSPRVPITPSSPTLPRSGAPSGPLACFGIGAVIAGSGVVVLANDRRHRRRV